MRHSVITVVGVVTFAGFGGNLAQASPIFAPLQTNLTALDPLSHVVGTESESGNSYGQTGTGARSNSNEISDSAGTASPGDQAVVVHYQTTDFPANSFFDVFVELSIPPGPLGQLQIGLNNSTGTAQNVSDSGYFLSPTLIPLDQLNENNYPDSSFTPIPGLTESLGSPGTDSAAVSLPEPSTIGLIALGGLLLPRRSRGTNTKA